MKKMHIKTGRQAERTVKELKKLRKLEIPIGIPAKIQTPQDNPLTVVISKNVKSTSNSKKSFSKTAQSKPRRRQKTSSYRRDKDSDDGQSEPVGFREMIWRLLHKLCDREPTLTLKTLQILGYMLVFIVIVISGCVLYIFHDKGEQVLEFIAGDHQHSEASRVVVSSEKKASP